MPSLALQLSDLATETGNYLGFGRTATNWQGWDINNLYIPAAVGSVGGNDTQLGWIMACIQAGLRQFYFPKPVDGGPIAHKWSFLTQQRSLTVVANQTTYDLPEDFNGLESEFTYQPTAAQFCTVKRYGIGQVMRFLEQYLSTTSPPQYCALVPKASQGVAGQRWEIWFAPIPDTTYILTASWNITPLAISAQYPYPLGGAMHGETILESCLAVAESRFQDEQTNHRAAFQERLQASITVDIRDNKPAYLGYNGDRSDFAPGYGAWAPWGTYFSPIIGATYDGQPIS